MSRAIIADEMAKKKNTIREYLASLGRKGGKARLIKMTPEQRRAIARNAAKARWAREKKVDDANRR